MAVTYGLKRHTKSSDDGETAYWELKTRNRWSKSTRPKESTWNEYRVKNTIGREKLALNKTGVKNVEVFRIKWSLNITTKRTFNMKTKSFPNPEKFSHSCQNVKRKFTLRNFLQPLRYSKFHKVSIKTQNFRYLH